MSDEAAFWAALVASPADDTHWLVFADWLQDANRPEAEFIRLFVAASARPGEAEFQRGWRRLKTLRRSLPPAWVAEFGRLWSTRPLQFRVSSVQRLGTNPPQEMFDRVLSIVSGKLISGAMRVGQSIALPLAAGGESAQRVWGLMASARTVDRLSAGSELREIELVWSGHGVADLGIAVGELIRETPETKLVAAPDSMA